MKFGNTTLTLKQGDITAEVVDVIVNAANSGLLGGGGVDGAIHRAGGPDILAACKVIRASRGGCPTGDAVITTAGRLNATYVVHTVGPIFRGGAQGEPDQLRSAYTSSLRLAAANGAKTVAFPSISTGVYGYPIREAASIALTAVRDFCQRNSSLEEVRFILFSSQDLETYQQAARALTGTANP